MQSHLNGQCQSQLSSMATNPGVQIAAQMLLGTRPDCQAGSTLPCDNEAATPVLCQGLGLTARPDC